VRIWTGDGQLRKTLPDSIGVVAVAFDPRGERLATAGPGRVVRFWRLGTGAPEPTAFEIPRGRAVALAFSPDGNQLATGGTDGRVRLWTLSPRRQRILGEHRDSVTSVSFSPDGRKLVTASVDEDPRIWNLEGGKSRSRALTGHLATVSDAQFSADGRWVVTAGHGTAGLWEVRSARLLVRLRGHIGMLHAAVFAPRGYTLYTAGEDGSLRKYTCEVCGPIRDLRALAARRLQAGRPR
jgi:WD40 repeat protein